MSEGTRKLGSWQAKLTINNLHVYDYAELQKTRIATRLGMDATCSMFSFNNALSFPHRAEISSVQLNFRGCH